MARRISPKGSLMVCLSSRLSLCYLQMFGIFFLFILDSLVCNPKTLCIKHLVFSCVHLGRLQFHTPLNRIKKVTRFLKTKSFVNARESTGGLGSRSDLKNKSTTWTENRDKALTLVVLTLLPVLQDHPVRSGRTLHSSPSMHGCIWHHHFWATMEAEGKSTTETIIHA